MLRIYDEWMQWMPELGAMFVAIAKVDRMPRLIERGEDISVGVMLAKQLKDSLCSTPLRQIVMDEGYFHDCTLSKVNGFGAIFVKTSGRQESNSSTGLN